MCLLKPVWPQHREAVHGITDSGARLACLHGTRWPWLRDLAESSGRLGLFKAIVGYRPGEGAGFTAYARPTIAGEVKRYFRDHCWMVRPPRRVQELHSQLRMVEPQLEQQLHRAPSGREVAHALGVDQGELSEVLTAGGAYTASH